MQEYLIEMLECPECHGELRWNITARQGNHIESGDARCAACGMLYSIREGIGIFLAARHQRNDLWEQAESNLTRYVREHPDVEKQLMDVPLDALAPADQFFRALVLEDRGQFAEAQLAEESAQQGLYTRESLACHESQLEYVVEALANTKHPIIDLASGRGRLVERLTPLARTLNVPIVATDFSVRVLRRNRRWLEYAGLYDRVSLLAFDARQTPFKRGTIKTLTTNVGLSNIEAPDKLLHELRRIVAGRFLAISQFYPEDDRINASAIERAGLSTFLFRRSEMDAFVNAGWQVEVVNACAANAQPTPKGVVLEGAMIDAFPVAATILEWGVLTNGAS
jgi:uncharacterized protein YbaR (Trm112 family)